MDLSDVPAGSLMAVEQPQPRQRFRNPQLGQWLPLSETGLIVSACSTVPVGR
jgi:hypothetical protein